MNAQPESTDDLLRDPTLEAGATAGSPTPLPAARGGGMRIAVVAFGVLLVLGALWWLHGRGGAPVVPLARQSTIPLVSVMTPGLSPVSTSVTFNGSIGARWDMPIGNDGDAGRIVAVYVESGQRVARGQVLARLDDSVLRPQVDRLTAALEQARAQAALSAAEYRRAQSVEAAGALSAEDIEKRRATSITDAANVRVVAAQLAESEARLARTRIVAPTAGIVLTRRAEVGQIALPGQEALFRLAAEGEIEMRGQVAEQDLARLHVGQPAQVLLAGVPQPYRGKVRLLGAVIDAQSRLGDVRIRLEPDPGLRPGAFARASVAVGESRRPVLPQTAVLADSRGSYVYVVGPDGRVSRREVQVRGTQGAGLVIASGLDGSERVVTTAGSFLREGETVQTTPVAASREVPAAPAPRIGWRAGP